MSSRREAERRLRALASASVPAPDARFVEDTARHLRTQGVPRVRRRPAAIRPVMALATAAAVVAAIALSMTERATDLPEGAVRLASSTDTIVTLPDGTSVEARDGFVVPAGSEIRTGPSGRVRADGVRLGPNERARVSSGRLVTPTPPAAVRPTPAPPTVVRATPAPTPQRSVRPEPTARPPASVRPAPDATPSIGVLRLACQRSREGILCRWSAYAGPGFAGYRLLRDGVVVFGTDDASRVSYLDTQVRLEGAYAYRIEAVDASGAVIASGGPVRAA